MKKIVVTDKGLIRDFNEDNYILNEFDGKNCCFCSVMDGMGGENNGKFASYLCKSLFELYLDNYISINNEKKFLLNACRKINEYLFKYSQLNNLGMIGTTFAGGFFYKRYGSIINVGDSRIMLISKHDRTLKLLTKDHIPKDYLNNSVNNNFITMAVGSSDLISPDYYEFLINDDSIIIICTDGVYKYISNDELVSMCVETNFDNISASLSKMLYERGAPDNFTLILLKDFYE